MHNSKGRPTVHSFLLNVIKPETNKKPAKHAWQKSARKLIRNKSTVHFFSIIFLCSSSSAHGVYLEAHLIRVTSSFEKKVEFHLRTIARWLRSYPIWFEFPIARRPSSSFYVCKSLSEAVCYYCFGYYFVLSSSASLFLLSFFPSLHAFYMHGVWYGKQAKPAPWRD